MDGEVRGSVLFVVRGGRKGEDIIFVVLLSPFSEEDDGGERLRRLIDGEKRLKESIVLDKRSHDNCQVGCWHRNKYCQ